MMMAAIVKSWILGPWLVQRGKTKHRQVALTFDDGPHPVYTVQILDILNKFNTKATFFLVGERALAHPQLVKRMILEGHEVGNHSLTHAEFNVLSLKQIAAEVDGADKILRDLGVSSPSVWFRPPKGVLNLRTLWFAITRKRPYAMWSNDPKDFHASSADELKAHFAKQVLVAGDIVLLHDKTEVTVQALPSVLQQIEKSGLKATTFSLLVA